MLDGFVDSFLKEEISLASRHIPVSERTVSSYKLVRATEDFLSDC